MWAAVPMLRIRSFWWSRAWAFLMLSSLRPMAGHLAGKSTEMESDRTVPNETFGQGLGEHSPRGAGDPLELLLLRDGGALHLALRREQELVREALRRGLLVLERRLDRTLAGPAEGHVEPT